jgi:hypothetical protein
LFLEENDFQIGQESSLNWLGDACWSIPKYPRGLGSNLGMCESLIFTEREGQ